MKSFWHGGYSFLKVLVILTVVVLVICVGIPSIKTMAGQTGNRACENNIATITRLENEYYKQMGRHTDEYVNLGVVDVNSELYEIGLLSQDDIICKQTGGHYQWQCIDDEIVLVCTGHKDE